MPGKAETVSLTTIIRTCRNLADALLELERDAQGLQRQRDGVPHEVTDAGWPDVLEKAQARLDRRYRLIVGAAPKSAPPIADPEEIRRAIDALQRISDLADAGLELAALPIRARPIWPADESYYDFVEGSQRRLVFAAGQNLKLRDDGSLIAGAEELE